MKKQFSEIKSAGRSVQRLTPVELPSILWLWLPVTLFIIPPISYVADRNFYDRWILNEMGLMENLTVFFLLVAMGVAVAALRRPWPLFRVYQQRWIILLAIACFYFCGEELSWGQHFFRWATPEWWSDANRQEETNLHNLQGPGSMLLNVFPRILVSLFLGGAGIILPLIAYSKGWVTEKSDSYLYWLMPTIICVPTSVLAILPRVPRKIVKELYGSAPEWMNILGHGETKECMVSLFLLLYPTSLFVRIRRSPSLSGSNTDHMAELD